MGELMAVCQNDKACAGFKLRNPVDPVDVMQDKDEE